MHAARYGWGGFRRATSFMLSGAAHALLLFMIIALPTCARIRKPEHKIYTFDLIDPSLLTMRKPREAPKAPKKKPPKKEEKKPQPEKKPEKKADKKKIIKKKVELPKKSIEERIKDQLKKMEDKEWAEAEEFEKAKLLDTGAFTNAWYNDAVASKIYQCWQTPSKALAEKEGLSVVVRFRIMKDGRVIIVGVDRRSGNDVLDGSALQAIQDAEPLPPLPDDYKGDSLEVCMTFIPVSEE